MASNAFYNGTIPGRGRWFSGLKRGGVGGDLTYPFEFKVDPALPNLGQELPYPSNDYVVIPRGRIVAAKATSLTRTEPETLVTIANGVDPLDAPSFATGVNAGNLPIGYAPFHYMRSMYGRPADAPTVGNLHSIEVPYTSINESYNTSSNGGSRLVCGELVMPYFGSAITTTPTPQDKGKIVRYVPKQLFFENVTASSTIILTYAPFPGIKPKILSAYQNGNNALIPSGSASIAYNTTHQKWTATFTGVAPASILYEYGAPRSQVVGRIIGIEPVSTAGGINATSHELPGWLKWVTDDFGMWDMPPVLGQNPTTSVTSEEVTIDSANEGVLAYHPVQPFKAVTVVVTGTLTNPDGTSTTLLATTMSLADDVTFTDYSRGQYYDIDIFTGRIRFAHNVSITKVNVSYSYETDFKDGARFDRGILGLTDGSLSGIVGLPPHLDVAGVLGALRVAIFGD